MINWAKPILINGVHETFKLAGTLNGCQVVIITDPHGVQTLFVVNDHGESSRFSIHGPGPKFSNEPEAIERTQFRNVYADGKLGTLWDSREQADRSRTRAAEGCSRRRVAVQGITTRIYSDPGSVVGKWVETKTETWPIACDEN